MELPLNNSTETPPPRRPQMAVSFAAGEDSGSSMLDSVSSVASSFGIDLTSDSVDPWQRSVSTIVSESYLAPQVAQATIILAHDSQAPTFNLNDVGNIQLGYHENDLTTVFTGSITAIHTSLENRTSLNICNAGYTLAQLRTDQSFEQQTAGDIVKALAELAEVETDTVEDGLSLPFYVIDSSRNLYQHIAALAGKSGLLATINNQGKLNFKSVPASSAERTFTYGVDIMGLKMTRISPSLDKITVVGAGATGSQGSDAWSWLLKDPQTVMASTGDGEKTRVVVDPSLRSSENVQQASAGKLFFSNRQGVKTKLTVIGVAEIQAGSKIEIAGVPHEELNGTAVVESVRHHFDKKKGFFSEIYALKEVGDSLDSLLSSALGSLGGLL